MPFRNAKHAHRQCGRRQTVARLGIFRNSKDALSQAEVTFLSPPIRKNAHFVRWFTQKSDTTFYPKTLTDPSFVRFQPKVHAIARGADARTWGNMGWPHVAPPNAASEWANGCQNPSNSTPNPYNSPYGQGLFSFLCCIFAK